MKTEEIYNTWKGQRSQIEVSKSFSGKVMSQIYQYEHGKRMPLIDMHRVAELISTHPLAKAGVIIAATIIGIIRVAFVICVFLGT